MIETLAGFPGNVVAFACGGRITKAEYQAALIPAVKEALANHKKVRIYCEIGADLAAIDAGALWADLTFGLRHFFRWERMALVTPIEGIPRAIRVLKFLIPAETRVFSASETAAARAWIVAP